MKVYTGSASVECDGIVMSGNGSGPVRVYAGAATVEVRQDAPPPVEAGELTVELLNLQRIVAIGAWHDTGSNYERQQELLVIDPDKPGNVTGWRGDLSNYENLYLPAKRYALLADGVEVAYADVAEGARTWAWTVPAGAFARGWRTLSIGGLSDGECCPTYFCFVLGGAQDRMPICTGSYDLSQHRIEEVRAEHAWGWVPTTLTPTVAPTKRRGPYEPVAVGDSIQHDMILPGCGGNRPWINVDRRGVISTFARQGYYWEDTTRKYPRVALTDGPRGAASMAMATHIELGRAAPMLTGPIWNAYVLDPWRVCKLRDSGELITLAGYRHKGGMPSYWKDEPGATLELVGDWSAIPEARRGFHELWGMCWDSSSLITDESAEPIPSERNLKPHLGDGPLMLVTDTQNNRVCGLRFSPVQHGVPAKVTEWMTGLRDPWDIVEWQGCAIISERQAHRIVQVDLRTREVVRVILERDPALPGNAKVQASPRRMILDGCTLAEAQAQPCLGPEGLYIMDDWLYWGSYVQQQVRRVHLVTGERETVIAGGLIFGNSKFIKLAVSDGTFGPKHTVFPQTWSGEQNSAMLPWLPDGMRWKLAKWTAFQPLGYGSAVAVRDGRMLVGSSHYGIWRFSKGAPIDKRRFARGEDEFNHRHGLQRWGMQGYSHHGAALPWGEHTDMDYFLETCGHTPP